MSELKPGKVQNPPPLDVRIGCPATLDPSRTLPEVDLFSPLTIEGITFRNRIAVSPMCQYSSEEGLANDWHLVHLGSRAAGGAGLILVEATAVIRDGRITPGDMGIWGDQHIEPLARIARFLEGQGTVPGIQLAHAGRKASCAPPWTGGARLKAAEEGAWDVVAPSPIPFREDDPTPIELDKKGIDEIVEAFGAATRRALKAGFRIIEIHMAHGYLLHEFLSPLSNKRTDEYGGSLENRSRLPLRVVEAVKAELPADSPLFVRISATDWVEGGWDLEQSVELGKAFCKAGVKLIDVSSGALVPHAKIPVADGFQVPWRRRSAESRGIGTAAVGMIGEPQAGQRDHHLGGRRPGPRGPGRASRPLLADPRPEGPQQDPELADRLRLCCRTEGAWMTGPRRGFTLGTLMALVLIAGVAAGFVRLAWVARRYDQRVAYHDRRRAQAGGIKGLSWDGSHWVLRPAFRPNIRRAAYHTEMALKYAQAARHPWMTVVPDPPEPE